MKEAVRDFIQGRSSYAVIKERKDVSVGTLSSWVHDFGNTCMSPLEIAQALKLNQNNRWSGILLLDGKYIRKGCVLLLAVDYQTLDIVAWMVVEAETEANYTMLVDAVETCGYAIKALISDGHPSIIALTTLKKQFVPKGTRTYPRPSFKPVPEKKQQKARLEGIPHQWCCVHAERELRTLIGKTGEKHAGLKKLIHSILFAKTKQQAETYKKKLLLATYENKQKIYQQVTSWLLSHWDMLTIHHAIRINKRKIPSHSNTIENVISYVNTRLKTMRKLRTKQSATPICNLIVVNYRTKPLQNTKNKLKKGKSPLALAVGKNQRLDWFDLIKNQPLK